MRRRRKDDGDNGKSLKPSRQIIAPTRKLSTYDEFDESDELDESHECDEGENMTNLTNPTNLTRRLDYVVPFEAPRESKQVR